MRDFAVPPMMEDCLEYLEKRSELESSFKYEILIVNDGSKDKTSEVALSYSQKYGTEKVRLLELKENRGKGGAVRLVCHSAPILCPFLLPFIYFIGSEKRWFFI